jgi:energy-converting hydrogenase Eha subunit A
MLWQIPLLIVVFVVWDYVARLAVGLAVGSFTRKRIANTEDPARMLRKTAAALFLTDLILLPITIIGGYLIGLTLVSRGIDRGNASPVFIFYILCRLAVVGRSWKVWRSVQPT